MLGKRARSPEGSSSLPSPALFAGITVDDTEVRNSVLEAFKDPEVRKEGTPTGHVLAHGTVTERFVRVRDELVPELLTLPLSLFMLDLFTVLEPAQLRTAFGGSSTESLQQKVALLTAYLQDCGILANRKAALVCSRLWTLLQPVQQEGLVTAIKQYPRLNKSWQSLQPASQQGSAQPQSQEAAGDEKMDIDRRKCVEELVDITEQWKVIGPQRNERLARAIRQNKLSPSPGREVFSSAQRCMNAAEFAATVGQMASQHAPLLRHRRSVEAALHIVKTNTVRLQTENCKLANTTQQKQAVAGSSASEASCAASTPDTSGYALQLAHGVKVDFNTDWDLHSLFPNRPKREVPTVAASADRQETGFRATGDNPCTADHTKGLSQYCSADCHEVLRRGYRCTAEIMDVT